MAERYDRLRRAREARQEEAAVEPPRPRRRIPFGQFESWIDRQIRQAQERGDFDNLAGKGRPLGPPDQSEVFAGDDALGLRLLKNNEALPAWIELNKEIAADEAVCGRILAYYTAEPDRERRGRLADDYRRRAGELNRKIEHYNYIVPATFLEKVKRQIERDLREADERRWAERDDRR
jgi:hypothetical protein